MLVQKWVEIEVDAVRVRAPIRYDDEREQLGMSSVDFTIDLATGAVRGWVPGRTVDMHTKVVDTGTYELLSGDSVVATRAEDYVPGFFPGDHYGDYLILRVDGDGNVDGWKSNDRRFDERVSEAFFDYFQPRPMP